MMKLFCILSLFAIINAVVSLSFSCESGCAFKSTTEDDGDMLQACDCSDESHSYWNGQFKFTECDLSMGIYTGAYATSNSSDHFIVYYKSSFEGACLNSYQGKTALTIIQPDAGVEEQQLIIVDNKEHSLVTTQTFKTNEIAYVYSYDYHCTVNLEFTIQEF